jgi:hypothetical protein
VVVDLPPHHRGFADHGVREIGRAGGGGVHHHRQRSLQRMREIAGMRARFLRLAVGVLEKGIELFHQRLHFERQIFRHAGGASRAQSPDCLAYLAQGEQAVPGLHAGHRQQPQAKPREAVDQDRADRLDLQVQFLAAGGNGEHPLGPATRKDDRALHDAERLARELLAVVRVRHRVEVPSGHVQRAVP